MGNLSDSVDLAAQPNDVILAIVCPIVGLIGFILNLISIAIISKFKEPLFFYLRVELIFVCADLLVTVFKPLYYCRTCVVSTTLFANLYYLIFNVYLASVLELGAIMCRNVCAVMCFLLISSHCRSIRFILKKSYTKIVTPVILFSSLILYLYQLFEYKITRSSDDTTNKTVYVYQVEKTQFGVSFTKSYIEIAVMSFRDAVNVGILFVFNVMIIVITKMNLDEKKSILDYTNRLRINYFDRYLEYCNNTAMIRRLARKENKQTLMIILTCINCLVGRLPILIFFVKKNITLRDDGNTKYGSLMVYISYSIYFFVYYHSNYKFRKLFKLYMGRLVGAGSPPFTDPETESQKEFKTSNC